MDTHRNPRLRQPDSTFATLFAVENGHWVAASEGMIGGLIVSGLVIAVVSAIHKRLVEIDAARAMTVGVVSHELRNNLAGVVGVISLITDKDTELIPEEVDERATSDIGARAATRCSSSPSPRRPIRRWTLSVTAPEMSSVG